MELSTGRLRLTPMMSAQADGADGLPDWPETAARHVLGALCEAGNGTPWVPWVARNVEGGIVGDAGFKGPPDEDGAVEMGWFIRPADRRRGLAYEAVSALAVWALAHGARFVRAEIHRDNAASMGVARRAGFTLVGVGDDDLHLWFERRREAKSP